jgi:hypothetical protein
MAVEDAAQTRLVQREISRRNIDITQLDIHVHHGVVYLRGIVKRMRGHELDLNHEIQIICHMLRARPDVRDVINEVTIRQ